MTRHVEDREIRRYLLGDLPEHEETALEAAYFGDPELLARLELIATDLADEYAASRMPLTDRTNYERRLLGNAEGREEVAFARALQVANGPEARNGGAERAGAIPAWLGWAAAALVIVSSGYVAWQSWSADGRIASDAPAIATTPPTTAPATPAAPAPEPGAPAAPEAPAIRVATLILTADLARAEGQPPTLIAAPDITHVDLLFPASDVTGTSARPRIESVEGQAIWTGPIERLATGPSNARARARLPVASLPPGDYIFSIANGPTDGPSYYFRVRAR